MPFTRHNGEQGHRVLDAVMLWRLAVVLVGVLASASLVLSTALYADQDADSDRLNDVVIEVRAVAIESEDSLCALRRDIEKRIEVSEQFLEDNPQGVGGISPEVIKQGLANQRATVDALSDLSC